MPPMYKYRHGPLRLEDLVVVYVCSVLRVDLVYLCLVRLVRLVPPNRLHRRR